MRRAVFAVVLLGSGCGRFDFTERARDASVDADTEPDASCVTGACPVITLATGQQAPYGITVDESFAYWVNYMTGAIMKCPLTGCNGAVAPTQLALGEPNSFFLAVDTDNVYFTINGSDKVDSCPLTGCTGGPTLLAMPMAPTFIVLDASSMYTTTNTGDVERIPKPGSSFATLISGESNPGGIAIDATRIYWTETVAGTGAVRACSLPSCTSVVTLVGNQDQPSAIAVDATGVYWTTTTAVWGAALDGSNAHVLAANEQPSCCGIAVRDGDVYWTDDLDPGRVLKLAKSGGSPIELATDQHNAATVTVDATYAYWTTRGDGTVKKTQR